MKKSWLRYLGLLGFIGLLGNVTGNFGLYGFFGFFGFFGYERIVHDERFEANVNRAARNAFIFSLVIFAAAVVFVSFTSNTAAYAVAFAVSFAVQILAFSISLQYYEKRGA